MSTDKSCTTAVLRFYPNKHIEVEIDGLANVHPRALDIASNLLRKNYLEKRAKFNANEHRKARAAKAKVIEDEATKEKEFNEKEDKRLAKAAAEKLKKASEIEKESVAEKEAANDEKGEEDAVA